MLKEFFSAARRGDLESFKEELKNTDITVIDSNDQTALHIAAGSGYLNIVEYILAHFPDADIINDVASGGNTALHLAATQEVYDLLIAHGATIAENNIGQLPHFAHENEAAVSDEGRNDANSVDTILHGNNERDMTLYNSNAVNDSSENVTMPYNLIGEHHYTWGSGGLLAY